MSRSAQGSPPSRRSVLVLATGMALLLSLAGSALKSTVQVDIVHMAHDLHVGLDGFAVSTTIFALMIAAASPFVGHFADRFGGAVTLTSGAVLAGAAFLLCAVSPNIAVFVLSYGLLGAFAFTFLSFIPLAVLVDRLFEGRGEGLSYATLTNGPAIGFIVLVPLWVWLQSIASWRTVLFAVGLVFWVVLAPIAWSLRRFTDGGGAAVEATVDETPLARRLVNIVRIPSFSLLAIAFFGCGVTMAFIDVHLVADLEMNHVAPGITSATLVILGIMEILGSLVAGHYCDKGLIKRTLIGAYALRSTAMFLIALSPHAVSALAFGALFGTSYLMSVVATTMWVFKILPKHVRGTGMGVIWTVHSIGAALSSQLGASLRQATDSYYLPSLLAAIVVLVSTMIAAGLAEPLSAPAATATDTDGEEALGVAMHETSRITQESVALGDGNTL
jgi:predicted MFS family arabinose efflux permease